MDAAELLGAGPTAELGLNHDPMTLRLLGRVDGATFGLSRDAAGGSYDVTISPEGFCFSGRSEGVVVTIPAGNLPVAEVPITVAESAFRVVVPMPVSLEPQDGALALRLDGLTVGNEETWSTMGTPPAALEALPRDPMTLAIGLSGTARWIADMLDPEAAAQAGDTAPIVVDEVAADEFLLSAGGVTLTGSGGFEIDTAAPVPQPAGSVDLHLAGGRAFLDALVAAGAVTEDQALHLRVISEIFALPGDDPETLVTEITVEPGGAILANGLPSPVMRVAGLGLALAAAPPGTSGSCVRKARCSRSRSRIPPAHRPRCRRAARSPSGPGRPSPSRSRSTRRGPDLRATLRHGGRLPFTPDTITPVLADGAPTEVALVLAAVAASARGLSGSA